MNRERKIKETLAKKLSGIRAPRKLESKNEQAGTKSEFFQESKNKVKSSKNINKTKEAPVQLENIKKRSAYNSEPSENDFIDLDTKEILTRRSSRNIKTESIDDAKSSIAVIKAKPIKVSKKPTKNKSPIKEEEISDRKKLKEELSDEKWQPSNWNIMLDNIRSMRSKDKAPVDTMGCHKCADENADAKTQRFHKLVALMLSSQTKDETTFHAMLRLREYNLTPESICNMKLNVLENILHPVSFYKNKAKYMQQTSKILIEKYNSDIPNNIKELVALPGVGPKMAHICMSTAWHEVTGIGVDVHVHRISNRIGWLPKPTKEPEQTRIGLEAWLPQHLWSEVNHLLVGFGQTICTPVKPKCIECLNFKICPSATKIAKRKEV